MAYAEYVSSACRSAILRRVFKLLSGRSGSGASSASPGQTTFPSSFSVDSVPDFTSDFPGFGDVFDSFHAFIPPVFPRELPAFRVPVNLLTVPSGTVVDLNFCYLPPKWQLFDFVDGMALEDVHYRTTVQETEVVKEKDLWGGELLPCRFIQPKNEIAHGVPVNTLYKRKADKVKPSNIPLSDGSVPEGHNS